MCIFWTTKLIEVIVKYCTYQTLSEWQKQNKEQQVYINKWNWSLYDKIRHKSYFLLFPIERVFEK